MNCDKAQELFSEYHEGALAEGLRLKLKGHFDNCASCAADFESFQRAYGAFSSFGPTPVPDDLGEIVARRLDRVDFERKHTSSKPFGWIRIGAIAGAAAAAVGIAVFYRPNVGHGTGANIVGPPVSGRPLDVAIEKQDGVIHIRFVAREETRVDVLEGGTVEAILPPNDAKPVRVDTVTAGSRYDVPVNVEGPIPQPLWLRVTGVKETIGVFFPQPSVLTSRTFTGDVPETLQALANGYGVVVEARLTEPGKPTKQNLQGTDALAAAKQALPGFREIKLSQGVLHVR